MARSQLLTATIMFTGYLLARQLAEEDQMFFPIWVRMSGKVATRITSLHCDIVSQLPGQPNGNRVDQLCSERLGSH